MIKAFKRLTISLFFGANLCTILLLWLCVGLTFVSPGLIPRLSPVTLAFPIFLCVDILFILFWLLFHARLVWVPIIGALVVGGYILDYCPLHFGGNNNDTRGVSDSTITVISYNVGHMTTSEQRTELFNFLKAVDADIVCMQEIGNQFFTEHKDWLDSVSYRTLQSGSVAILSRLPLLSDTIHINYPTRSNRSLACWIDCGGDSLFLINNHLESNQLSEEEKNEYTNTIIDPHRQTIKSSSRKLLGKLSEAAEYRGAQTDSICSLIKRNANHAAIVCGDLNETPISYTYQRLSDCLVSAYREAGNGPGFTYSRRSFPVRIDHVFYSSHWTCTSCYIDRTISSSDHYPLIVHLRPKSH